MFKFPAAFSTDADLLAPRSNSADTGMFPPFAASVLSSTFVYVTCTARRTLCCTTLARVDTSLGVAYCIIVLRFAHPTIVSLKLFSSVPHPSENHIHLRIQMYGALAWAISPSSASSDIATPDGLSSLTALLEALANLDDLCVTIDEGYNNSLAGEKYERWDEKS